MKSKIRLMAKPTGALRLIGALELVPENDDDHKVVEELRRYRGDCEVTDYRGTTTVTFHLHMVD